MSKNKLNKLIDTSRDERNHLWTSFLLLLGGSLTVLFQNGLNIKGYIATIGLFLSILLFFLYLKKSIQIDKFIDKLED